MTFLRKALISSAGLAVLGSMGYLIYSAYAVQGHGTLAQAPLNIQSSVTPAFIMAVDDSGSMTFQHQFPAADGYAWWSNSDASFFSSAGTLRTTGSTDYAYSYTGARISTGFHGIPPIDKFGFSRSPYYNPSYFNPMVKYEPWLNSDGAPYGSTAANPEGHASLTATRIDPRQTADINLAADLREANDRTLFRAAYHMALPQGTEYRLRGSNNCGGLSGGDVWRTVGSGGHTLSTNCDLYIKYYPATFFLPYTAAGDPRPAPADAPAAYASVSRVRVDDVCGAGCDMWKYTIHSSDTAALQNFANWFSFYGNRNRAMVAGMTHSMVDVSNMRVGYFTINGAYGDVTMRDMAVPAQKAALYGNMLALPYSGSTPNLPAVNHMGAQFRRTDAGAPIQLACQKNGGMLFTDGFSNVASTAPAITGLGAPFDPTPANSMAAIASQFYFNNAGASPLRADLAAGKVPVPDACGSLAPSSTEWKRLDCQTNLHMNFYGVTLGGRGNIFNPDLQQDAYLLNPAWPGYASGARSTVDDIWHAAVNTRGEFINAKTPVDITTAMRRILATVGGGDTPSGSIALTGSRVGAGSLSVVPAFTSANNGTDWYSTLTAQSVSANATTGAIQFLPLWEASTQLPAAGARNILVGKTATSVVPTVGLFDSTTVSLNDLCNGPLSRCIGTGAGRTAIAGTGLGLNITLADAISYLRGDQALETAAKPLRERTNRLGDIVNSSPLVSSPNNDYGYRALHGATAGTYNPYNYDAYLTAKKTRRPMVYAGANDGMFHAFDGLTGVEQFAYIPATSLDHMGNLLFPYKAADKNDQVFSHRYYVDGPVTVSDAHYGGTWKTVVVGTAGAGGRGVFALNVSDPASFGTSNVLWEVNDKVSSTAIKNNIGHVLGKPVIVPVKVGTVVEWKAIFGNGYDSINKAAVLFVVDIATGAVTTIGASEASQPGPNGLGNIIVLDRFFGSTASAGRDGYADTVYAADQNGAVWKFDLRTSSPTALTVPLFVATDSGGARQAIIGGFEAAAGPGAGVMLYFGTGSFSFVNDPADRQVQSLYAVLDTGTAVNRSQLHEQTAVSDSATGVRMTTATAIPAGKRGWFIDLIVGAAATGERFVGNPRVESGVIFFPTFDPDNTDVCATGGTNRLYGLNALSGAAGLSQVRVGSPTGTSPGLGTGALSLNTTGSSPVKDVAVWVAPRLGPLASTATEEEVEDALESRCSMVIQVAGAPSALYLPRPCGRQSWRQVR